MLADSGVVGELIGGSPLDEGYLGRVRYLGVVYGNRGERLNIRQFAVTGSAGTDRNAPLYLILGTSGNVGKTTAGIAVLRALRMQGLFDGNRAKGDRHLIISGNPKVPGFRRGACFRLHRFRPPRHLSVAPLGVRRHLR